MPRFKDRDHDEGPFGSGGLILDRELIAKLHHTPPLPPSDLLKIAQFYKGYETNRALSDHLTLVALTHIVAEPELQQGIERTLIKQAAAVNKVLSANAADLEDLLDWGRDEGGTDPFPLLFIRQVPLPGSGLNLLVETNRKQERFFIIGVSPDVDKLPHLE